MITGKGTMTKKTVISPENQVNLATALPNPLDYISNRREVRKIRF